MDNVQKRREDDTWQTPVDLKGSDSLSSARGMTIPALSLAYEAQASVKLWRLEGAERLLHARRRTWSRNKSKLARPNMSRFCSFKQLT